MADKSTEMKIVRLFDVNAFTNPPTSVAIDRLGFESLTILLSLSTGVFIGGTGTATLKHGDTSVVANMTDVPASEYFGSTLGALVPADAGKDYKVSYRGSKRYVSLVITEDTAWTSWLMSGYGLLSDPIKLPIA